MKDGVTDVQHKRRCSECCLMLFVQMLLFGSLFEIPISLGLEPLEDLQGRIPYSSTLRHPAWIQPDVESIYVVRAEIYEPSADPESMMNQPLKCWHLMARYMTLHLCCNLQIVSVLVWMPFKATEPVTHSQKNGTLKYCI